MKGTTHAKSSVATRKAPARRKAANTNDKGGATVRKRSAAVRGKRNTAVRAGSKPSSRTRRVVAARKSRTTASVSRYSITPAEVWAKRDMQFELHKDDNDLTRREAIVLIVALAALVIIILLVARAVEAFLRWAF